MPTQSPSRWWLRPTFFFLVVVVADILWPPSMRSLWVSQAGAVVAIFWFAHRDERRRRNEEIRGGVFEWSSEKIGPRWRWS
jgi:hypothetical protein